MALKRTEVEEKLLHKFGFEPVDGTRHDAVAFFYDGRKIATTRFSRGMKGDVSPDILKAMAEEVRVVTLSYFKEMITCTKSKDDYIRFLREQGWIQ